MKKPGWLMHVALMMVASVALHAQTPEYPVTEAQAPQDVAQALRERVNQFFQFHMGTVNRRAIDLVAEDTKDYYFSSGKVQFISVKLNELNFSKDLQTAAANLDTTQTWQVQQYSSVVTTPVVTNWKLEDGKWVFYIDKQQLARFTTPMGESAPPANPTGKLAPEPLLNADGTMNIPKDFADPERVAAQAQAIMAQAGTNKETVAFVFGQAGEDQVTFHNGFNGQVSLQLSGDPRLPGLKIALDKANLNGAEDAHVRLTYDPAATAPLGEYRLLLNLIPFNQQYSIRVQIAPAKN